MQRNPTGLLAGVIGVCWRRRPVGHGVDFVGHGRKPPNDAALAGELTVQLALIAFARKMLATPGDHRWRIGGPARAVDLPGDDDRGRSCAVVQLAAGAADDPCGVTASSVSIVNADCGHAAGGELDPPTRCRLWWCWCWTLIVTAHNTSIYRTA
ncbi:MAG: hypothetical protein R2856_11960 [Caldilineaceae bacterium]